MSQGLILPIVGTWLISFLCYALAGVLLWRRIIRKNAHIVLTVMGFLADIAALAMKQIHMMQVGRTLDDMDAGLRSMETITLNLSMAMYCVVALLGFSRIVGWKGLGRWHVPVAGLFMVNWILARIFSWQVLGL